MTVFARPGSTGALMSFESRYDNFIGGEWIDPGIGGGIHNVRNNLHAMRSGSVPFLAVWSLLTKDGD